MYEFFSPRVAEFTAAASFVLSPLRPSAHLIPDMMISSVLGLLPASKPPATIATCGIVINHSPKEIALVVSTLLGSLKLPKTEKRKDPRKKATGAPIVEPKLAW